MQKAITAVTVRRVRGGRTTTARDSVTTEEPLEIRVVAHAKGRRQAHSVAVTMRTPGNDDELAAGFLFTEGILGGAGEIDGMSGALPDGVELSAIRARSEPLPPGEENVIHVCLKPGIRFDTHLLTRNFYMTSSCGVCGKASLNALRIRGVAPLAQGKAKVPAAVITGLSKALAMRQTVFRKTGGLHAAALFDARGRLLAMREDVGRHNAMDKLIGNQVLKEKTPLGKSIAFLSGRASWELMQKALVARIPIVVAVGAPSSLAIELAKEFNVTLAGFARGDSFNIYAGAERIGV
jgi:FdhD protein